jgi:signal transduction histidine kinase
VKTAHPLNPRLALVTTVTGVLVVSILATVVIMFRAELRRDVRDKIVQRYAAVLYPMAEAQLREAEINPSNRAFVTEMLLPVVLKSGEQEGMLGVVIFDVEGNMLQSQPTNLLVNGLAPDDYARLVGGQPVTRYHPEFALDRYFSGVTGDPANRITQVLEVLLPLRAGQTGEAVGFVQYFINAERLTQELNDIDSRVNRQSIGTLAIGSTLIAIVLIFAYRGLARAQRTIAERNERLTRANFELTLAAKTSALGVITSHLIHGLQGPVAGLRAMMADRAIDDTTAPDWQSAATYTERMQTMIHETVALLGDTTTQTSYELSGTELAATIRERNCAAAVAKGVALAVDQGFAETLDSHRGSLICLIATNLVQNAIEATDPGRHVEVSLTRDLDHVRLVVRDEGAGIPNSIRTHLFEPGRTGRAGGTGLGLSISQLLARQIGATLELVDSSPAGTTFRLTMALG